MFFGHFTYTVHTLKFPIIRETRHNIVLIESTTGILLSDNCIKMIFAVLDV